MSAQVPLRRLRRDLLTRTLLVVALPMLGFGLFGYLLLRQDLIEQGGEFYKASAVELGQAIDRNLFERYGDVQVFAFNPMARGTPEQVTRAANFCTTAYTFYDLMIIADLRGRVIAANTVDHTGKPIPTQKLLGRDVSQESWFRRCASGKMVPDESHTEDLTTDPLSQEVYGHQGLALRFAAPIYDEQGKVVRVWLNLASWERIIGRLVNDHKTRLAQMGYGGVEIALTSQVGLLVHETGEQFRAYQALDSLPLEAVQRSSQQQDGYTYETDPASGRSQVIGHARMDGFGPYQGHGWGLILRQAPGTTAGQLFRLVLLLTGCVATTIGVVAAALTRITGSLARAIEETQSAVEQLASGALHVRVRHNRPDELGLMGEALNRACGSISQALGTHQVDWAQLGQSRVELQRIQAMLEQSPSNVIFADREHRVRYLNASSRQTLQKLERYLPVPADRVMGGPVDLLYPRAGQGGDGKPARIQLGPETLAMAMQPITGEDRQTLGFMLTWEVITEQVRLQEQVAQNAERERTAREAEQATAAETNRKADRILEVVRRIAAGDFTQQVEDLGDDALGQMAVALNQSIAAIRQTLQSIQRVASTLGKASEELSCAAEEISAGAQSQASSLQETSTSLKEITGTVSQSSTHTVQARELAINSRTIAEAGGGVVRQAMEAMGEINHSAKKIASITNSIEVIAFQTNLLALNAAVEAARAGSEGRGFAVVANEVRNLAQHSSTAAKEITALIQDSVRKVEVGSELVNRSGDSLTGILQSVQKVTDIISEIAVGSKDQSLGIQSIHTAVSMMNEVTHQNASRTEKLSSLSDHLSDEARQLIEMVSHFQLEEDTPRPRRALQAIKNGYTHRN